MQHREMLIQAAAFGLCAAESFREQHSGQPSYEEAEYRVLDQLEGLAYWCAERGVDFSRVVDRSLRCLARQQAGPIAAALRGYIVSIELDAATYEWIADVAGANGIAIDEAASKLYQDDHGLVIPEHALAGVSA